MAKNNLIQGINPRNGNNCANRPPMKKEGARMVSLTMADRKAAEVVKRRRAQERMQERIGLIDEICVLNERNKELVIENKKLKMQTELDSIRIQEMKRELVAPEAYFMGNDVMRGGRFSSYKSLEKALKQDSLKKRKNPIDFVVECLIFITHGSKIDKRNASWRATYLWQKQPIEASFTLINKSIFTFEYFMFLTLFQFRSKVTRSIMNNIKLLKGSNESDIGHKNAKDEELLSLRDLNNLVDDTAGIIIENEIGEACRKK